MSKTVVEMDTAFFPGGFAEGDRVVFLTRKADGKKIAVEARVTSVLHACTPEQREGLNTSGHAEEGEVYNETLYVPEEFLWK